jgi:chloramphenicol-sensitive protein RarD
MENKSKPRPQSLVGVACGSSAFLIWGLSPLYWKMLQAVPAFEIIMHRMVWSFLFLIPILLLRRRWHDFTAVFRNLRIILVLLSTSVIVGTNWFVYIWAINHDHVLQASLGYFINPLVNVLLGMVFLRERLRPLQFLAVGLAGIAVLYLVLQYGEFPWVALFLAFSFGFYGLIRKVAPVTALVGLSVETLVLSAPALAYLFYLAAAGSGSFLRVNILVDLLLMGAALVTALPLLLFTLGARRLHLSTVGFLQYIAPSCMFLLAVLAFHEPLYRHQLWTFLLIWAALSVYSVDSLIFYKRAAYYPPDED